MSWSLYLPRGSTVEAARTTLDAQSEGWPAGMRDYVAAGIDGLVRLHGPGVLLDVTAYGHLSSPDSLEETDATVSVRVHPGP